MRGGQIKDWALYSIKNVAMTLWVIATVVRVIATVVIATQSCMYAVAPLEADGR